MSPCILCFHPYLWFIVLVRIHKTQAPPVLQVPRQPLKKQMTDTCHMIKSEQERHVKQNVMKSSNHFTKIHLLPPLSPSVSVTKGETSNLPHNWSWKLAKMSTGIVNHCLHLPTYFCVTLMSQCKQSPWDHRHTACLHARLPPLGNFGFHWAI